MSEWQPIESAPKDSSLVFAWREGWEVPWFVRWYDHHPRDQSISGWEDGFELDQWWDLKQEPPTHWLPLPPLPNVQSLTFENCYWDAARSPHNTEVPR